LKERWFMTKLERILDTLRHKEPEVVSSNIAFADPNAQRKFAPKFNPWDWRKNEMEYLEFLDSYVVEVEHGELLCKVVERSESYHIVAFESGVQWRITETPDWSRKYFNYPVQSERNLEKMVLPDADDPRRYEGASKDDGREIRVRNPLYLAPNV